MRSPSAGGEPFLRLVRSFAAGDPPAVVVLSGGEPMLRPALVTELAGAAHEAGAEVSVVSGMFFARQRPSGRILEALRSVDLVTASIDRFHEREVPRRAVLGVLAELIHAGVDVSLQVTVEDGDAGYLPGLVEQVDRELSPEVPIFVSRLAGIGRGGGLVESGDVAGAAGPSPCTLAAWPVVTWDGRIVACCSQPVVDGPAPGHLLLGDAAVDGWTTVRRRIRSSPLLRSIRTIGPLETALQAGRACGGYCETCAGLQGVSPDLPEVMERLVVAAQVDAGAVAYAARFGVPEYAPMVARGSSAVAA
jgi:hypothetical protein